MVWRGDIEKHYENVTKTYQVMNLLDQNDLAMRDGLRTLIILSFCVRWGRTFR